MQIDRDPLYQVLLNLPVQSIGRYCKTSREANSICQKDQFWKEKLKHDFPQLNITNQYIYSLLHENLQNIINKLFTDSPDRGNGVPVGYQVEFFAKPIIPLELRYKYKIGGNEYFEPEPNFLIASTDYYLFEQSKYPRSQLYFFVKRNRGDPNINELIKEGKISLTDDIQYIIKELLNSGNYIAKRSPSSNQSEILKLKKLGLTTQIN